tara:strand:+ start:2493 stop:2870 length:378 start_codon:yes stop_codon:yes gene_type:complete
MEEIFLKLITNDSEQLAIRFLIVPVFLLVYYFLLIFFTRRKPSAEILDNFLINYQFSKIYSSIIVVLLLNIYWYFLIRLNGLDKFDWSFTYEISNIYLQLSPFILTNVILIYIYFKSKEKLNSII